jgi:FSR family fosmidomycin resistance protein-like MFS transporter
MNRALTLAAKLGAIHALVDAAGAAILYSEVAADRFPFETLLAMVLFYDALSLGLQWIVGILADGRQSYRLACVAGVWLIALGALVEQPAPWLGAALAGIGNAGFHVGAGATVLRRSCGRAAESGVFVGLGAIGLVSGVWLGSNSNDWRGPFVVLLVLAGFWLQPHIPARLPPPQPERCLAIAPGRLAAIILLLFGTIAIRSIAGGLLGGSWPSPVWAGFALAGAAMAGKSIGGLCGDRLGWRRTSGAALILAAPLAAAGLDRVDLAIIAMFALQVTMPITLAALYATLPGRPGLVFGLPCLALLLGALPGLTGQMSAAWMADMIAPVTLLSALMVVLGLGFVAAGERVLRPGAHR